MPDPLPDPTPTPAAPDARRPPEGRSACSCRADDPVRRLVESIDAALADTPSGEAVLLTLTAAPPAPPTCATSARQAAEGDTTPEGAAATTAPVATAPDGATGRPDTAPHAATTAPDGATGRPGAAPRADVAAATHDDASAAGAGAAGPGPATGARRAGDVGWLPLGGRHPLDVLLGFVAPPAWDAIGVACSGQALAEPGDLAAAERPVRVTTLLTRAGRAVTVLREPGRARRLGEVPGGALGDALHRTLGLPTAPPPPSSAALWVTWWLDRIVEAAVTAPPSVRWPVPGPLAGSPAGWATVAGRHPACPFAPRGRGPRPATLAAAARDLARRWPWCRLRTDPRMRVTFVVGGADGDVATLPDLPPQAIADWMDDGMYARWLLSSFPALDDLLDACDHVLPDALADRVRTTVSLTLRPAPSSPATPPRPASPAPAAASPPAPAPTPAPAPPASSPMAT